MFYGTAMVNRLRLCPTRRLQQTLDQRIRLGQGVASVQRVLRASRGTLDLVPGGLGRLSAGPHCAGREAKLQAADVRRLPVGNLPRLNAVA